MEVGIQSNTTIRFSCGIKCWAGQGETVMNKTNKLAILGGRPVRTRQFPAWPVHDKNEIKSIHEVVKSGKWWRGRSGK